jgi:hypothetical protein
VACRCAEDRVCYFAAAAAQHPCGNSHVSPSGAGHPHLVAGRSLGGRDTTRQKVYKHEGEGREGVSEAAGVYNRADGGQALVRAVASVCSPVCWPGKHTHCRGLGVNLWLFRR